MPDKPFSLSCERNQKPILEVLLRVVGQGRRHLLEVGTGTGQHAVSMAPHFSTMEWLTSDQKTQHIGIKQWLDEVEWPNLKGPIAFEVGKDGFPPGIFDVVFTANTFHIMAWPFVQQLIDLCGKNLAQDALMIVYGPFNYQGKFTSNSNAQFDAMLRRNNPSQGIRDFEAVEQSAQKAGFVLQEDVSMPANNHMLIFRLMHV